MARFKEADARLLNKMNLHGTCYTRNAPRATRCRECKLDHLQPEGKGIEKGVIAFR